MLDWVKDGLGFWLLQKYCPYLSDELHSVHQGVTAMTVKAESSVF